MDEPAGVVKIVAQPGREELVAAVLEKMATVAGSDDGTEIYAVHRARKDPSVFFLYELYRDPEALKRHQENPHLKELGPELRAAAATIEVLLGNLVAGDRAARAAVAP